MSLPPASSWREKSLVRSSPLFSVSRAFSVPPTTLLGGILQKLKLLFAQPLYPVLPEILVPEAAL